MKKVLSIFMISLCSITLVACGDNDNKKNIKDSPQKTEKIQKHKETVSQKKKIAKQKQDEADKKALTDSMNQGFDYEVTQSDGAIAKIEYSDKNKEIDVYTNAKFYNADRNSQKAFLKEFGPRIQNLYTANLADGDKDKTPPLMIWGADGNLIASSKALNLRDYKFY